MRVLGSAFTHFCCAQHSPRSLGNPYENGVLPFEPKTPYIYRHYVSSHDIFIAILQVPADLSRVFRFHAHCLDVLPSKVSSRMQCHYHDTSTEILCLHFFQSIARCPRVGTAVRGEQLFCGLVLSLVRSCPHSTAAFVTEQADRQWGGDGWPYPCLPCVGCG